MTLLLRSLVVTLALSLVTAGTVISRLDLGEGTSSQAAETGATSIQASTSGAEHQVNQGSARGFSTQQEETSPSGNRQVTNNQAAIQTLQQAAGNGSDGVLQTTNNQINIESNQLQQNVNGTLVNVEAGEEGVVIINANDLFPGLGQPGDASVQSTGNGSFISVEQQDNLANASQITSNVGLIQALQQVGGGNGSGDGGLQTASNQVNVQATQQQENVNGTLVNIDESQQGVIIINKNDETGARVNQTVINKKPIAEETEDSARCRYICRRTTLPSRELYCCDHGFNQDLGTSLRHPGKCPLQLEVCDPAQALTKCAFDSQCAENLVCCYDNCQQHHVCHEPRWV